MIVGPRRGGRGRSKDLSAFRQGEMAVDLARGEHGGVEVDVAFSLANGFKDICRIGIRADGHNVPNIGAIRLRGGIINVENDFARGMIQIWVDMDVMPGEGAGKSAIREF